MGKLFEQIVHQEDTQMANKHRKILNIISH